MWYEKTFIKFELIKNLQHKYLSYMFIENNKSILRRYFFGYNLIMFDEAIKKIGNPITKRFYSDLATWNNMMPFSWDVQKRKEQKDVWESKKEIEIIGFDFAMDFDANNKAQWKDAYKDAKKIYNLFSKNKIPFSITWSGQRGFHIKIENKYMPSGKAILKPTKYKKFASILKAKHNLKTLDEGIYHIDRILKLPYSIDSKTNLVVLPLDDNQFTNFQPEICEPNNVLQKIVIKNRGMQERQGTKENVSIMLKKYGL